MATRSTWSRFSTRSTASAGCSNKFSKVDVVSSTIDPEELYDTDPGADMLAALCGLESLESVAGPQ
jgi:hypothetical protein